jgi:hypothetical protein
MGSKVRDAGSLGGRSYYVPYRLGRDAFTPDFAQATYAPKDRATSYASCCDPIVDGAFRPCWDRNGADVLSFADQVGDHPVLLADLEIYRFQSNQFCPSQAASDEQSQNGAVTFASEAIR